MLKPSLICTNFKIKILLVKIALFNQILLLSVLFCYWKIVEIHPHINTVKLCLVALNKNNFFHSFFDIESLRVFSKFILSDLGEIENIINKKVQNFLTGHLNLYTFLIFFQYLPQLIPNSFSTRILILYQLIYALIKNHLPDILTMNRVRRVTHLMRHHCIDLRHKPPLRICLLTHHLRRNIDNLYNFTLS